ncbi:ATPase, T2SS/T4P/T4SS family, partial [uncultured Methanobrevibacter sp.]|uniref:ATPase, T2SS/T4P/T4SS family n=1 Tax=uncultured Methanobrevibacter sp. TaxID=253161 RepID=UPI0025EC3AE4
MNKDIIPQYDVTKQEYSPEEKILLGEMRENLVDLAISSGDNFQVSEEKLLNDIKGFLFLRLNGKAQDNDVPNEYLDRLSRKFLRDIIGYGAIDPLIQDDELEEIMIIGTGKPIFIYHREYGMMKTNLRFNDESELRDLIDSIARQINRRIDQESPILDGRLIDGSRINATIPPVSADGPSLTIRKFRRDPLTIIDLINSRTISLDLAGFLWLCIDGLGVKSA